MLTTSLIVPLQRGHSTCLRFCAKFDTDPDLTKNLHLDNLMRVESFQTHFTPVETELWFRPMPIRTYLEGHRFDAETTRLIGIAFEMAIVALQHSEGTVNPTRDAVAKTIIQLAKAGERNPGRLCDAALQALRPAIVSDPDPLPPQASREEPRNDR